MAGKRKTYAPRELKDLTGAVVVWLWIFIAMLAADSAALAFQVRALAGLGPQLDFPTHMPRPVALLAVLIGLLELLTLLVMVVSGFLSLKWIYRADANAHTLTKGLTISPPWAVGFFFVPFLYLVRPYQAVREIWQVSTRPQGWRGRSDPAVLRWWWGLWLGGNFVDYFASIVEKDRGTAHGLLVGYGALLAAKALHLIANLFFMVIVVQIRTRQARALAAHAMSLDEEPAQSWLP